jgi:geranylgeranyl pyrophosphate synthase
MLAACETRLHAVVSGFAPEVSEPAAATLAAGGKRLRPLLVFCRAPPPTRRP